MATSIPNTATTLSLNSTPGQYVRLFNTQSDSVFTFGDFVLQVPIASDSMTGSPLSVQFEPFSTLQSLSGANLNTQATVYVKENELKNPSKDPKTYSYFSSFVTEVAAAMSDIMENFPFAALSYSNGIGTTIYNYSEYYDNTQLSWFSTFSIPYSSLINQGGLSFNSGNTNTNTSVVENISQFAIQLSGDSQPIFDIVNYSFSSVTGYSYLIFTINGRLSCLSASTSTTQGVYIRPTTVFLNEYNRNIPKLENQILNVGVFYVPDTYYSDGSSYPQTFIWPTTIDGFNPDTSGDAFSAYQTKLLAAAQKIDDEKTNIFLKSLIPDAYSDYDSDSQLLTTIIQTYAQEFDLLKRYVDGIAYAHSINYNNEESVPDKFMYKLSQLLGWNLSNSFSDSDIFEYLVGENDDEDNSTSTFNLEIWRRILVNLVWLFKKKGTRDAMTFILTLLGAPDCLLTLDEFVYKINQSYSTLSPKVNNNGYINYDYSNLIFQEGGDGRGNGQDYINQWEPEFTPTKTLDNQKVWVADPTIQTQDTINTKEINIGLDPAKAIECDVFNFYQVPCLCSGDTWVDEVDDAYTDETGEDYELLGCSGMTINTVPADVLIEICAEYGPVPQNITGFTLSQYLDYLYTNLIEPRNRKTNNQAHTSWQYPELTKAYLTYYYYTNPTSNKLTIKKLESYLEMIEKPIRDYFYQLIPATTIFGSIGSIYRNPLFHRQRFVYREGINCGSEFQIGLPPNLSAVIFTPVINMSVIGALTSSVVSTRLSSNYISALSVSNSILNLGSNIIGTLNTAVSSYSISTKGSTNLSKKIGAASVSSSIVGSSSSVVYVV